MPTLLDLLDIKHPTPERPMDGKSLKKLILGQKDIKRKLPIGGWKYASNKEKNNKPWIEDQSLCEMITMTTRQIDRKKRNKGIYIPDSFLNYRHPVAGNAPFVGDSTWIDDRYKLIVLNNGKRAELYDLTEDPKELNNIASQHPEIVKKMRKELENWQISVENSLTGADYTKQIK